MHTVLTIAGSDCSGGAGFQADLKTMTAHKCYGMSAFTCFTSQNTTGIKGVFDISPEYIAEQIDACCEDIFPDATKTGAVFDEPKIKIITERLKFWKVKNVVVDPVMVCTANGGVTDCLLKPEAITSMIDDLFSVADIITPNIPEAEVLYEKIKGEKMKITNHEDMEKAARVISEKVLNKCVFLKGGHSVNCDDCLYFDEKITWFKGERINTKNTHGTGCTLSSAIACNLALGFDMIESCKKAKEYVAGAIKNNPNLGKGFGPINHCWNMK